MTDNNRVIKQALKNLRKQQNAEPHGVDKLIKQRQKKSMTDDQPDDIEIANLIIKEIGPENLEDLEALHNADVSFEIAVTITIKEKQFEAVKKLIKADYDELAEEVNEGCYMV